MNLLFAGILFLVSIVRVNGQTSDVFAELKFAAKQVNKMTPYQKDGVTRIDSVKAIPKDKLVYYCTLIDTSRKVSDVKDTVEAVMLHEIKTKPSYKTIREYKVTVQMKYFDLNKSFLFLLSFTPDKY